MQSPTRLFSPFLLWSNSGVSDFSGVSPINKFHVMPSDLLTAYHSTDAPDFPFFGRAGWLVRWKSDFVSFDWISSDMSHRIALLTLDAWPRSFLAVDRQHLMSRMWGSLEVPMHRLLSSTCTKVSSSLLRTVHRHRHSVVCSTQLDFAPAWFPAPGLFRPSSTTTVTRHLKEARLCHTRVR